MRHGGRSFFEVTDISLPRAFHPKARSHCPVAELSENLIDRASERREVKCALGVDLNHATKSQRTERRLLLETGEKLRLGPATVEVPMMTLSGYEAFDGDSRAAIAMNFYMYTRQACKPSNGGT